MFLFDNATIFYLFHKIYTMRSSVCTSVFVDIIHSLRSNSCPQIYSLIFNCSSSIMTDDISNSLNEEFCTHFHRRRTSNYFVSIFLCESISISSHKRISRSVHSQILFIGSPEIVSILSWYWCVVPRDIVDIQKLFIDWFYPICWTESNEDIDEKAGEHRFN